MSKIRIMLAFLIAACFVSVPQMALAADFNDDACSIADEVQKDALGCGETREATSVFRDIVNVVVMVTGIVAVLVIVVGGQRYITSSGDAGRLSSAKDMILWGIVGLIAASVAGLAVNFVLKAVAG